jgi:two-component system chemotaxis response regulator CheB
MMGEHKADRPVALTCPECGGAMKETRIGAMPYFECHIGHRLALENLELAQYHSLEETLELALRHVNERMELCRRMAALSRETGSLLAGQWEAAVRQAEERYGAIRGLAEQDWLRPSAEGTGGAAAKAPDRSGPRLSTRSQI